MTRGDILSVMVLPFLCGLAIDKNRLSQHILKIIYSFTLFQGNDNKPRFANPAGTQRAAVILGVSVEEIAELIFTPPIVSQIIVRSPRRKAAGRLSSSSSKEPHAADDQSGVGNQRLTQCNDALEGLAIGLYQEAFGILVFLINRQIFKVLLR